MKKSKSYTEYILIKAQVQSEWDSCNGCIVDISGANKELLYTGDRGY